MFKNRIADALPASIQSPAPIGHGFALCLVAASPYALMAQLAAQQQAYQQAVETARLDARREALGDVLQPTTN